MVSHPKLSTMVEILSQPTPLGRLASNPPPHLPATLQQLFQSTNLFAICLHLKAIHISMLRKKIRPSKDGLRSEEINKMIVDIDFTTPSLYGATSN